MGAQLRSGEREALKEERTQLEEEKEKLEDDQMLLDEETGYVDEDYDRDQRGRDSAYDSRGDEYVSWNIFLNVYKYFFSIFC